MVRSLGYALGVAAAGALATAIAHGAHDGLVVAAILAPLGALTVVVAHQIVRARGLRRQFAAMAALVVAQLAALIALMAAAMFVEGADAFFTVVAAGYAAAIGLWAGRLLERGALKRLEAEERARRDLVAAVSHDLRTPITSLRLLAEPVRDDLGRGRRAPRAAGRRAGDRGRRHRPRHPARRARARLRALRAGPRPRGAQRRLGRPRPRHRPGDRRGPRRPHLARGRQPGHARALQPPARLIRGQGGADGGPRPMEEHALVGVREAQGGGDVARAPAGEVAQDD